ncbi:MAG: hypothetical protein IJS66_03465 [Bacteroidales bacterium]|nr:hypothetical protein [Bacteroidales bacterium]
MKKVLAVFTAALVAMNLYAQKTTVAVGEVAGGSNVNNNRVETLRSLIISGLSASPRLNVLDVKNLGMTTSAVKLEELQKYNVEVLVTAKINSMSGSSEYKDGKYNYKAEMLYVITLTDTSTGQVIGTKEKHHYGSSTENSESAFASTFTLIDEDMKRLVDEKFPLTGKVVTIDQSHPKKGAQAVYVELGSDLGLKAGDRFDVYKIVEVAGQQISKLIGAGKVKEISSGALSLCQISKGGVEIQEAINSGLTVYIKTKPSIIPDIF